MNATLDRRGFLQGSAALVLAVAVPRADAAGASPAVGPAVGPAGTTPAASRLLTPYLLLGADGRATLYSPTTEMGQGTHTAHALIVADELGLDPSGVEVITPEPSDPFRRGPAQGPKSMASGGSWGVRAWYTPLRTAAAQAREMLVATAATRLGVAAAELSTRDGKVVHAASGRELPFGALVHDAAKLSPPAQPTLKERSELSLVGRGIPRLDSRDKSTGRTEYSSDFRVPGMLYACGRMAPVFKAEPVRFDAAAAKRVPGVVEVVAVPGGVAVIAKTQWAAMSGADALEVEWTKPPIAAVSSREISAAMREGLAADDAIVAKDAPNYAEVAARATRTIEADYEVPYLAHAPMEAWSCTVRPNADGTLEIWGPFQGQDRALTTAAAVAKLPADKVRLRTLPLGGGFGRRLGDDGVPPAVTAALAVKQPVKFFWTREDEFARGWYRPAQAARLRASIAADGTILALHTRVAGPSLRAEFSPAGLKPGEVDGSSVQNLAEARYRFEAHRIEYVLRHFAIPVAPWRSVGATHNAFFLECFLDEVAKATSQDPVALRRALLAHDARALRVVDTAADAAGWSKPPPKGIARGFAYFECYGSLCAQVAEVTLRDGRPRVTKVVVALDCGDVILPDQARAQVEGGVIQGLSTAMHEAVTIADGAAVERNFDRYRLLAIGDAPPVIDVHFVRSGEALGGVGEPPVPPVIPAVANALSRLTGRRIRELPILRA
jgi:isoquinoline 1-oxidoreductase subunit beta